VSGPLSAVELFLLAGQLMDPKSVPLYLSGDNKNAGWGSSPVEAWRSDRAFCCDVRPEVIPIDVDQRQQRHLDQYRRVLEDSGFPWLEVKSGGHTGENRHLYVWVDDKPRRDALIAALRAVCDREAVRVGQRMRPPGTPHRSGANISVPVDPSQARRFLNKVAPPTEAIKAKLRPSTRHDLDSSPPNGDRSRWDQHVCFHLVVDELTCTEIVQLAVTGTGPFSAKAREQPTHARSLDYMLRSIGNAQRIHDGGPGMIRSRADAKWILARLAYGASQIDPVVVGGPMARRVLEAAIDLFAEHSTLAWSLSERQVAENAGVHRHTARKWLHHLRTDGWLDLTEAACNGRAAVYELNTFRLVPLLGTSLGGCVPKSGTAMKVSRPSLFMWGFGGESGWQAVNTLASLGGEGRTCDIAQGAHISTGNIGRVLNRLQQLGVVDKARHGHWRLTDTDLDLLAEQWGADRVAKERHARHTTEQVLYGRYRLDRLAHRRPELPLQHLEVLDSNTVCDWNTGEMATINDL
jgi:hypothetical protein